MHIVATDKIIAFYVATVLILLYIVLSGKSGNSIDTELNILPSIYLFYCCFFLAIYQLEIE